MRAIVLFILLLTSIGQISIAGFASSILSVSRNNAHQITTLASEGKNSDHHLAVYHEGNDPIILEEVFEEDTEETDSKKTNSTSHFFDCTRAQQFSILHEAYLNKRFFPSIKYRVYNTVPIWIRNETYRL